jgi:hypothetical protein
MIKGFSFLLKNLMIKKFIPGDFVRTIKQAEKIKQK